MKFPCPHCRTPMTPAKPEVLPAKSQRQTCYVLTCGRCGLQLFGTACDDLPRRKR